MATPLTQDQIAEALEQLPGWHHEAGSLKTRVEFGSFREAISFIVRLAFHAEAMNHHPDLHNSYNVVEIALTTHDAGDEVTLKDVELARQVQQFIWRQPE
ncbi:MAG: 4a-hydroxytetrahydrobiopterin dehydratase [Phycisphaeraceae bacterium]